MQVRWSTLLQPLLDSPTARPVLLKGVSLSAGSNVVNHLLQRTLQGWTIVRMRGAFSQVYDTQDSNPRPELTLLLHASAPVVCDLLVF